MCIVATAWLYVRLLNPWTTMPILLVINKSIPSTAFFYLHRMQVTYATYHRKYAYILYGRQGCCKLAHHNLSIIPILLLGPYWCLCWKDLGPRKEVLLHESSVLYWGSMLMYGALGKHYSHSDSISNYDITITSNISVTKSEIVHLNNHH